MLIKVQVICGRIAQSTLGDLISYQLTYLCLCSSAIVKELRDIVSRISTQVHFFGIYLCVTNVLFHYLAFDPIIPIAVRAESVQDRKQRLVIWAGFYPQHARGSDVYTLS